MSFVLLFHPNTSLVTGHCQHRELRVRLEDSKKLRLYVGFATSKHWALEESLSKAKYWSRHWKGKAKEGTEKTVGAEKERDKAKKEAQVARLVTVAAGDSKAKAEGDLARVHNALAVMEEARVVTKEARCKAEVEATFLEVERTSLMLEIGCNFCLRLWVLCFQTQHLWRPTRGSRRYARLF